jgi:hypothetical protein
MSRILSTVLLLAGLAAAGCYYDNEEELYQFYYDSNPCDTSAITFSGTVFPIIQGNCTTTGCHVAGGTGPGLMENYAQVKALVDNGKFEDRVLVRRDMPPSAPLTPCQIQHLTLWIDAGAPDN